MFQPIRCRIAARRDEKVLRSGIQSSCTVMLITQHFSGDSRKSCVIHVSQDQIPRKS
ncbi:hypothetical protein PROPHIGD91-3_2 [Mycobacterium phage prophi91-3]|nr:hypothetical protein PROPHIGD91-3_2 [Mycobacterium phage prophi91-3]